MPTPVHVPLTELIGKTISRIEDGTVEGEDGDEPCIILHFTDGTCHAFVIRTEDD